MRQFLFPELFVFFVAAEDDTRLSCGEICQVPDLLVDDDASAEKGADVVDNDAIGRADGCRF
jgi:hypothetical protein